MRQSPPGHVCCVLAAALAALSSSAPGAEGDPPRGGEAPGGEGAVPSTENDARTETAKARADREPVRTLTLAECLEIARRQNLDVRSKEHAFEKSRLDVASARADFLPTFTLSTSRDPEEKTDSGSLSVSQTLPWGTEVTASGGYSTFSGSPSSDASVTVKQPLLRGRGTREGLAGLRKAHLAKDAEEMALERALQDVVHEVKTRYCEAQRQLATVEVRRAAVQRARRLLDEAAFKREMGMVTILDYANADIQFRDRNSALRSVETRRDDALDELKETLKLPLESEIDIEPVNLDLDKEIEVDDEAGTVSVVEAVRGARPSRRVVFEPVKLDADARREIRDRALANRPDLLAARLGLRSKGVDVGRVRGERRFTVDVSATVSGEGYASSFEQAFRIDEEGMVVSVSATLPLGRVKRKAAYGKALLDLEIEKISLEKQEIAARKELRRIFRRLSEAELNIVTYARKVKAAAQAVEAARIRKEQGQASYWEVTARESDLLDAQTSFINVYLEYQKQLASLDRASGVRTGWLDE